MNAIIRTLENLNLGARRCLLLCLFSTLLACGHGIDISGEGMVSSSSGERDCNAADAPCEFSVAGAYNETYTANPAAGYEFSGWGNCLPLGGLITVEDNICSYSIPGNFVRQNWGQRMPNLQAIFVPASPFGLTQRAPLADFSLPISGAALAQYQLEDKFPALRFSGALFLGANPVDGRLIVIEQAGIIHAFENSPAASTTQVVMDLSDRVTSTSEQGIIGLAFDPEFATNRYVYLHYSMLEPRRSVIARFTWDSVSDQLVLSSEKILLEVPQPAGNHNGGMLEFGPDGYLYIGLGDGGGAGDPWNNGQDTTTLLGSVLRIDVHPADLTQAYSIPLDNPFMDTPDARDEIYAFGLRNPFRFSFDRQTGRLWLGDVGQAEREEVNHIFAGGNYGWRVREGSLPFNEAGNTLPLDSFTPPFFEYSHSEGFSITSGYVYRGTAVPSLLGRYVYADYVTGNISALSFDSNGALDAQLLSNARRPTAFGEDVDGELYVVTRTQGIYGLVETAETAAEALPELLSETGLFSDLTTLQPASGLIEYTVNHPFYSDGALKRRWLAVPDGTAIGFQQDDSWQFPVGSIAVKHFEMELQEGQADSRKRLETRLLLHTAQGWQGFTYRWNENASDAELINSRQTETLQIEAADGSSRSQRYDYPSRTDCIGCHTEASGFTLGLNTAQINRDFQYASATDNQLRSLNNIALFDADIGSPSQYQRLPDRNDATASLAQRARAYLDVNCAQCHQPDGGTPVNLNLQREVSVADMNAVGNSPQAGDLGISGAQIIAAGSRRNSVLWRRMQRLDGNRMPPLSSHRVDQQGLNLIGDWIDSL